MTYQEERLPQQGGSLTQNCEVACREQRSETLFSSLHLVMEVRDRLMNLKQRLGSMERPCDAKEAPKQDIDPSNLVIVVHELKSEIQTVCAQMLNTIDDLEEDLL